MGYNGFDILISGIFDTSTFPFISILISGRIFLNLNKIKKNI
jgi:hypothetical protein